MKLILGLIFLLIIGAVLVSLVVLLIKGKRERYNRIYMGCQVAVILWCLSQILILLAESETEFVISIALANLGICSVGAIWYYFAVAYTGSSLNIIMKYLPAVLSVFHYVLVLTNPIHKLFYTNLQIWNIKHGPFFYSNVICTYVLVIWGAIILYRNIDSKQLEGFGKGFIIASVMIPVILNAVQLLGLIEFSFDITPLGFGISIICLFMAILKYDFLDLNQELIITNEKLLLATERNRIAQEVHDTAGHTLTMISSYLRLAQIENEQEHFNQVKEHLDGAIALSNSGLKELREAINRMRKEEQYELVTQGVMQLAGQVREIPIEVTVQGEDHSKYSPLSRIVYDCVRESITNTLKYAQATKMEIILRFMDNYVEIIMSDDGIGCENFKENNGIRGIRERVENAGGSVKWISGKGEGFLTRIHLDINAKNRRL